MRHIPLYTLLAILLSALISELNGQYLPFRTYSIELGLSESVAHAIVQDERGYIWVGTGYGLNRFDGVRFRQFYEDDGLTHNRIHSLYMDDEGVIWIGTDLGVTVLRLDTLSTPTEVEPLNQFVIRTIFQDSNGNYWFGTEANGGWILDSEGDLYSAHSIYDLKIVSVRAIEEEADGTIWIGSREGLVRIQNDDVTHFTGTETLEELRVRDLAFDPDGRLWIGSRGGLLQYSMGEFIHYCREDGIADNRILSVSVESNDRIWLGTEGGISFFNGEKFANYGREQGVPALIIYSSMIDREGNIWFGTLGGGITMFVGDFIRSFNIDNGLTNNVVTGFNENSSGDIWIATYGGGVLRYNGSEMINYSEADGLIDNKVYTIYEDSDGKVWIGTRDGISIYEDGQFEDLPQSIFPFSVIRKFYEDPESGDMWIATYNDGVIRFDGENYTQFNIGSGLFNNTVMDIKRDHDGSYWFATYGGVAIYDGEYFRHLTIADGLPSNGVIHIHIDHYGDKWFSTFNGVAKYDGEVVRSLPTSERIETISYFMEQDQNLNYWVGTNRGLFRIDPDKLLEQTEPRALLSAYRLFNQKQGLIANELNAGASLLASDGSFWLGTVEGLSQFYPDRAPEGKSPPGIEFEGIFINGNEIDPNRHHLLPNDQNFLEFVFTGLAYEAPDQIMYEYRLKGYDEEWQLTGERTIRYPSIPPGSYDFELRAYNADGVRSINSADFSFRILQPYYFQWWFIVLILLVITGLILFYLRYFRVRKQVDIERMRVQIASDLHDDVGSSLTELALQTDFLQAGNLDDEMRSTLKQLGEQSRRIVSSLDDIVWSIDSRNDTAGDLTDRMQDYVNQIFVHGNVDVQYNFDNLRMHEKLPVDVKENIYLIFKESVNNVVKHSDADKLEITFSFSGKTYELKISDNGTMIKRDRKSGQGLRNIRMRAERIGSVVDIAITDGFTVKATGSIK